MRININIRPSTRQVIESWAERYTKSQVTPVIDALLAYVGANYSFIVPTRVSSREEVGIYTVHWRVDVYDEDYLAILEQFGRRSSRISLSRILEYLIHEEQITPDILEFGDYDGTPISKTKMTDIRKVIENEQTRLLMLPKRVYDEVHDLWNDMFEELWPVLDYLCNKNALNIEAVDELRRAIDIAHKI